LRYYKLAQVYVKAPNKSLKARQTLSCLSQECGGFRDIQFSYPYSIDGHGRTGSTTKEDEHIKQLIEQVLFTAPSERINRPTFGSGINQLVFAPNSSELASTTQFLVQAALQQWLADKIDVKAVAVKSEESTLHVLVQYVIRTNQQGQISEFTRRGGA
jgi:phage baseplate assembly protein W